MFIDIKFPESISYTSIGGPQFSTTITNLRTGGEIRIPEWNTSRSKYMVHQVFKTKEQIDEIKTIFYIACGKAHSFRFKDWIDFSAEMQKINNVLYITETSIILQIEKEYEFSNNSIKRKITKIVPNSEIIYYQGEILSKDLYIINNIKGTVTIQNNLDIELLYISFQFDVEVRFEIDNLQISFSKDMSLFNCNNILLIEVIN